MLQHLDISPNGQRVATITHTPIPPGRADTKTLRMWDAKTWQADPTTMALNKDLSESYSRDFRMWDHDLFGLKGTFSFEDLHTVVYRFGQANPLGSSYEWSSPDPKSGDRLFDDGGRVFDMHTWQRLRPPSGQRYHSDLARFAPDGRFVYSRADSTVIDTRVQKQFAVPYRSVDSWVGHLRFGLVPGLGLVTAELNKFEGELRLIPTAHLDLPPAMLELWAQVAVRGELGPDGEFVPWNEPTWEKKRQQLAAMPTPHPDFPFPGYVATDKLHWLGSEFEAAQSREDKAEAIRLVKELLRRAEADGDKVEAVRWRTTLAKLAK